MKEKETNKKLLKLQKKTFKNIDKRDVFEPASVIGATFNEGSPILLTADKNAANMVLQFAGNTILLDAEMLDFLVKSITIMSAMTALSPVGQENELARISMVDNFIKNKHKFSVVRLVGVDVADVKIQEKAKEMIVPSKELIPEGIFGFSKKEDLGMLPGESELSFCIRKIEESRSISTELFYCIMENMSNIKKEGGLVPEEEIARINSIITENTTMVSQDLLELNFEQLSAYGKKMIKLTDEVFDIHRKYHGIGSISEKKRMINSLVSVFNKMPAKDKKFEDMMSTFLASNPSVADKEISEEIADETVSQVLEEVQEEIHEEILEKTQETKPFAFDESVLYESEPAKPFPFPTEEPEENLVQDQSIFNQDEEEIVQQQSEDLEYFEDFSHGNDSASSSPTEGTPVSAILPEDDLEEEDEDEDDPIFDDDDEDPTAAGSDFSKRMDDLEGMLTGKFELKAEELPSFEKIEKLKSEHGELAAKEYVASLTQEQRETLIRERIAIRDAALAKKESEQKAPEDLSEEK